MADYVSVEVLGVCEEYRSLAPRPSGDDLDLLRASMRERGFDESFPIIINPRGVILDGHTRYEIAKELGIEEVPVEVKEFDNELDEKLFVIDANLSRRHLNIAQKAELGLKRLEIERERAKERQRKAGELYHRGAPKKVPQNFGEPLGDKGEAMELAARAVGISDETLRKAVKIKEAASQDPSIKRAWQRALKGEVSVNRVYQMVRQKERAEVEPPPLPEGKFRVIYADPPWRYSNTGPEYYGPAERHYRTMSVEDLCAMGEKIRRITEDNAVLFLWVTSPMLEEAFKVIRAWGFEYKASFVWDKVRHNFGHYNSVRHEFLLVAVKGSCLPDTNKKFDSVVVVERSERHSEKPEEFRKIIDALYTKGRKLELFARRRVDGWECWGDEVEKQ